MILRPNQAFPWYFYRPDLHWTFFPSGTATTILEVCKRGLRYQQELQVWEWDLSAIDIRHQINLNWGNESVPSQAAGLNMPRSTIDRCVPPLHIHQGDPFHLACHSSDSGINVPNRETSAKSDSNKPDSSESTPPSSTGWIQLDWPCGAMVSCGNKCTFLQQENCWFSWKQESQY